MPDLAQRRIQCVLDHMAQDFGARQFAGVQVSPLGQQAPRLVFVTSVQRVADIGEEVAELAEAQG